MSKYLYLMIGATLAVLCIAGVFLVHNRSGVSETWLELELTDYCRVNGLTASASECENWAAIRLIDTTIREGVANCVTAEDHYSANVRACIRQVMLIPPKGDF